MPSSGKVTKVIEPGAVEYFMHGVADPAAESFLKKCTHTYRAL